MRVLDGIFPYNISLQTLNGIAGHNGEIECEEYHPEPMNIDSSDPSFLVLTVWTENLSGNVAVSVPSGLVPDATDPMLVGVTNYSDGTYKAFEFTDSDSFANAFASRSYRFFKTADYDQNSSFTVKIGEKQTQSIPTL